MSTSTMRWFALRINPEPWEIGPLSVGRKNGGLFPRVGQATNLHMYQEAIREDLRERDIEMLDGNIILRFFFWRQQAQYKSTATDRQVQRHVADATNLQKGLEDALQGILFANDRMVDDVRSVVVEQGPSVSPLIVIGIDSHNGSVPDGVLELPDAVYELLAREDERQQQLELDLAFPTSLTHPAADEDMF
jgi:Holliday junction resolvase RusA-like endonuclease